MARLVLLVLTIAFAGACLLPPDDTTQIRALAHARAAALARGDLTALYRLHDLDYRAVCPFTRFRALPPPAGGAVRAVEGILVRGVRARATLEVADGAALRSEPREFVRDGGRWYLYEDAAPCLVAGTQAMRDGDGR